VLARSGQETAGARHNRRFVADALSVADGVAPELVTLAHDPQTSGGLLAAVPPEMAPDVLADLRAVGDEAWVIGEAIGGSGVALA
jgi:selenide,water dikinase